MGWRFWRNEPHAELATGDEWDPTPDDDEEPEKPAWPQLYVTVLAAPPSTAPGTPIAVANEGEPLHVGDEVQVVGTFVTQYATVVAIHRDGVAVPQLDSEDEAQLVLDDEVDLDQVFRGTALIHPEDSEGQRESLAFEIGVLRAEPRGADALVVGRPRGDGDPEVGMTVQGTCGDGEAPWTAELRSVEVVDGDVALLLAGVRAERFLRGDLVFAVHR